MKKLFRVEIETETLVAAEDEDEARDLVYKLLRRGTLSDDVEAADVWPRLVTGEVDLPAGWDPSLLPWGNDKEDKTVQQYLDELKQP